MDSIAIIVMLLALLALIGVVVFLVYDYIKHKDSNAKDFEKTGEDITQERSDRLSNLKYVVDQVNDVNTDIYNTFTSNYSRLDASNSNIVNTQTNMMNSIDKFVKFTSNYSIPNAPTIKLMDLPGTNTPDVQLIQHVTAMMGITANDLGQPGVNLKFCNKDKSRCIEIPDKNGNTYLTSMDSNASVYVDGRLRVNGDISLLKTDAATMYPVRIGTDGNNMLMNARYFGMGNNFTNPQATLHVKANGSDNPLMISTGNLNSSDAIMVKADGTLITTKPISIRQNFADASDVARFSVATENNIPFLKVETNRMHVQGDFSVSGKATVGGQNVATVAPVNTASSSATTSTSSIATPVNTTSSATTSTSSIAA